MFEYIVIGLLVTLASFYLVRRFLNGKKGGTCACGCSGCAASGAGRFGQGGSGADEQAGSACCSNCGRGGSGA
ncbi:MAG: FeoB-associated Cys-rich membrane protein [Deltaproteobacteria bacterium]|nr:FeoB-associated Cys-rich membrane protein [Deltaproteobacteria bacterium]